MALDLKLASISRTHDISRISYHVSDLETFGDIVTKAAAAAFPNTKHSRYQNVFVLLFSWEHDELGVISEVQELDDVLSQIYHFHTEQWKIPNINSHNALAFRLMEFLKNYGTSSNLLLIYYGGHGHMNDDRQCIWSWYVSNSGHNGLKADIIKCSTETVDSPVVQWYGLQTMLEQSESDVVIFLDCCAAASSATASGNGVTELIAACGFETWAPGVGEHSFSRSLIEELKYLSHGPSFSITLLHSKVLSRMKYWKPRFTSAFASEARKTPIYVQLANELGRRSIVLGPLPPETPSSDHSASSSALIQSSASSSESDDNCMLDSETSRSSSAEVWPDPGFNCPKVLISIALKGDQLLRPDAWNEWLRSIPALAKYMTVQGIYKSDSTVVLGLLPVAIWDLLPKHPAILFVCFVKSENCLRTSAFVPTSATTKTDKKTSLKHEVKLEKEKLQQELDLGGERARKEADYGSLTTALATSHISTTRLDYNRFEGNAQGSPEPYERRSGTRYWYCCNPGCPHDGPYNEDMYITCVHGCEHQMCSGCHRTFVPRPWVFSKMNSGG